eukprot:9483928-Pyramimonas_sp.AAC.1
MRASQREGARNLDDASHNCVCPPGQTHWQGGPAMARHARLMSLDPMACCARVPTRGCIVQSTRG